MQQPPRLDHSHLAHHILITPSTRRGHKVAIERQRNKRNQREQVHGRRDRAQRLGQLHAPALRPVPSLQAPGAERGAQPAHERKGRGEGEEGEGERGREGRGLADRGEQHGGRAEGQGGEREGFRAGEGGGHGGRGRGCARRDACDRDGGEGSRDGGRGRVRGVHGARGTERGLERGGKWVWRAPCWLSLSFGLRAIEEDPFRLMFSGNEKLPDRDDRSWQWNVSRTSKHPKTFYGLNPCAAITARSNE